MTHIKLNWDKFALLLIDVQRDFWSEQAAKVHPDFPANIASLLTLCRKAGIEVIHLRASFKADMSDWMPKYILRGAIPCVEGTAGEEPVPFAIEDPGEMIICKHTFDGFYTQELLPYLLQKRKRFLLTAGLLTSTCVLFTTASAMQNGFLTAVIEDCCADEPTAHSQTLDRYGFIFERTTVGAITSRHSEWMATLNKLDQQKVNA
jgi:nicotinamidase-related amidase